MSPLLLPTTPALVQSCCVSVARQNERHLQENQRITQESQAWGNTEGASEVCFEAPWTLEMCQVRVNSEDKGQRQSWIT